MPDTDSAMTLAPFGFSSAPPSNQLCFLFLDGRRSESTGFDWSRVGRVVFLVDRNLPERQGARNLRHEGPLRKGAIAQIRGRNQRISARSNGVRGSAGWGPLTRQWRLNGLPG